MQIFYWQYLVLPESDRHWACFVDNLYDSSDIGFMICTVYDGWWIQYDIHHANDIWKTIHYVKNRFITIWSSFNLTSISNYQHIVKCSLANWCQYFFQSITDDRICVLIFNIAESDKVVPGYWNVGMRSNETLTDDSVLCSDQFIVWW